MCHYWFVDCCILVYSFDFYCCVTIYTTHFFLTKNKQVLFKISSFNVVEWFGTFLFWIQNIIKYWSQWHWHITWKSTNMPLIYLYECLISRCQKCVFIYLDMITAVKCDQISLFLLSQSSNPHIRICQNTFFSACSTHKKFLLKMRHQKCQSKNETIVFLNVNDGVSFPMKYPFDLDTKVFHFIFKNLSVSFLTNNFISDTKLNVNTMSADFCCLWYPQNKSIHENQLKNLNYVFFSVENCRLWTTKSKMIINKYFTTASLDELYSTDELYSIDKFQFIQNNNEKTHRKSTQIRTHLTCSELKWPASNLIDNSLTIKLFSRKRSTTAQH